MTTPTINWQHGQDYQVIDVAEGGSLLFITGNHRLLRGSSEVGERLRQGLHALSTEELEEWSQLMETGMISDVNRYRLASSQFSDGANLAVNINLTAFCNLGCTYCFADGGDYGRIKGRMEAQTVEY